MSTETIYSIVNGTRDNRNTEAKIYLSMGFWFWPNVA